MKFVLAPDSFERKYDSKRSLPSNEKWYTESNP